MSGVQAGANWVADQLWWIVLLFALYTIYQVWKERISWKGAIEMLLASIIVGLVLGLLLVDGIDWLAERFDNDLQDSYVRQRIVGVDPQDVVERKPAPPPEAVLPELAESDLKAPEVRGDLVPTDEDVRTECWKEARLSRLATATRGGTDWIPAGVQGIVSVENRGFLDIRENKWKLDIPEFDVVKYPISEQVGENLEDAANGGEFVGTGEWPSWSQCPNLAANHQIVLDEPLDTVPPTESQAPAVTTTATTFTGEIQEFEDPVGPLVLSGDLVLHPIRDASVDLQIYEPNEVDAFACGYWITRKDYWLLDCQNGKVGSRMFNPAIVLEPDLPAPELP